MKRRRPWAGHSYPLWVPLRACRVNRRTGTSRNAMQDAIASRVRSDRQKYHENDE